jgi:transposase
MAAPWDITDEEWTVLRPILARPAPATLRRGKPRLENDRAVARAALYHHFAALSDGYHTFGWNRLPCSFGVSPATANRRYREWLADGSWQRFWDVLMSLRRTPGLSQSFRLPADLPADQFPVPALASELVRAYRFFNDDFFGGSPLPDQVAITIQQPPRRAGKIGYFCGGRWRKAACRIDLICIYTSAFADGHESVLEVLIHEMVHLRNYHLGLVDSTNGRYHNGVFRDAALMAGLGCQPCDKNRGYGLTFLGPRAREAITRLEPALHLYEWRTV